MGMRAVHVAIPEASLDDLNEADDLGEALADLEESDADTFTLDKIWDGLHFLMTGVSADSPIDGDPLSEAIVGVHVFDDESDLFAGATEPDEVAHIVRALQAVDIDALVAAADFSAFADAELYPNIWSGDPTELRHELAEEFCGLRDFYVRAAAGGLAVVVSIL
ncbi:YfbM family protein [Microbacterium gorillae]|uniref:YfbM family protein n=1 Tax=Microbacterium gorillae TaxID=1231063 RepID=UPI0005917D92|nr:YfbM family protein [Microbacterium gorillae]